MPQIIHFDIPTDDPLRAQKFYQEVFEWKFEKWMDQWEYWMIKTGKEKQPGINGGSRGDCPDKFVLQIL